MIKLFFKYKKEIYSIFIYFTEAYINSNYSIFILYSNNSVLYFAWIKNKLGKLKFYVQLSKTKTMILHI